MRDVITKMNDAMTKMLVTMDKLEMRMLESTEKLDALIHVVDGIVRPPIPDELLRAESATRRSGKRSGGYIC